jgi:hypothetical protein
MAGEMVDLDRDASAGFRLNVPITLLALPGWLLACARCSWLRNFWEYIRRELRVGISFGIQWVLWQRVPFEHLRGRCVGSQWTAGNRHFHEWMNGLSRDES